MRIQKKPVARVLIISACILLIVLIMQPLQVIHFQNYIDILFPDGIIGIKELDMLLVIQALMLLVVLPVYLFTFLFSWWYRADNTKAIYDPDLVDNRLAEYFWWGIPLVMTLIVSVYTWVKTHELDPYKPIESDKKALTIQVVALQWKWLFIYPEQNIAAVNFFQFPKDTPLHFEITADAPMNSFWIPKLGGQIYAMPSMKTELYLMANKVGDFMGSSANISGEGFAGMNFIARSSSEEDFNKWVASVKESKDFLSAGSYKQLAAPSSYLPVQVYKLSDPHLFEQIIMKYMHPQKSE